MPFFIVLALVVGVALVVAGIRTRADLNKDRLQATECLKQAAIGYLLCPSFSDYRAQARGYVGEFPVEISLDSGQWCARTQTSTEGVILLLLPNSQEAAGQTDAMARELVVQNRTYRLLGAPSEFAECFFDRPALECLRSVRPDRVTIDNNRVEVIKRGWINEAAQVRLVVQLAVTLAGRIAAAKAQCSHESHPPQLESAGYRTPPVWVGDPPEEHALDARHAEEIRTVRNALPIRRDVSLFLAGGLTLFLGLVVCLLRWLLG